MQTLFSTRGLPARKSFRLWRETLAEQFVPGEQTALGRKPFEGTIEAAMVGDLTISRFTLDAMRTEVTPSTILRHAKHDKLALFVMLDGTNTAVQDGRESVQRAGDIAIYESILPAIAEYSDSTSFLYIEVPRRPLENALGPARLYSSLTVDGASGGGALATSFFRELVRLAGQFDHATGTRMAAIGLDLLTASMADRLARSVPCSVSGDVVVQRAKAYVAANLWDPLLDPGRVAAAAGVSLRRLQELFQERGRYVADWIWERRLEQASAKLSDPGCHRIAIGNISYSCGFISQAHFSTRFKRRFGLTPRDFRMRAHERRATLDVCVTIPR